MNRKNIAQQLFNISEDIYKSFHHIVFLEVCRVYQNISDELFIPKKPCTEKLSDRFLDSLEKSWKTQELTCVRYERICAETFSIKNSV